MPRSLVPSTQQGGLALRTDPLLCPRRHLGHLRFRVLNDTQLSKCDQLSLGQTQVLNSGVQSTYTGTPTHIHTVHIHTGAHMGMHIYGTHLGIQMHLDLLYPNKKQLMSDGGYLNRNAPRNCRLALIYAYFLVFRHKFTIQYFELLQIFELLNCLTCSPGPHHLMRPASYAPTSIFCM